MSRRPNTLPWAAAVVCLLGMRVAAAAVTSSPHAGCEIYGADDRKAGPVQGCCRDCLCRLPVLFFDNKAISHRDNPAPRRNSLGKFYQHFVDTKM